MLKKIFKILLVSLVAVSAHAQTTTEDLTGLCMMDGECASYIADNVAGGAVLSNNAYFKSSNQAGSANIDILKVDTGDNTVLNSSASDLMIFQFEDDAQRTIQVDASADTLIEVDWGDGGTTAAQNLEIRGGTADADDDSRLCLSGGGACEDLTRGAYLYLEGEQDGGGGDAALAAIDDVLITANDDLVLQGEGSGDSITLAGGGTAVDLTITDNNVTVADGTNLVFAEAAGTILPGATSISFRNTGDTDDNLIITEAGLATVKAGVTIETSWLRRSITGSFAAAGNSQGTAAAVTTDFVNVTSCTATTADGVLLPDVETNVGAQIIVMANCGESLDVWPATGDGIDANGTNAVDVIADGAVAIYTTGASDWYSNVQ